MNRWIPLLLPLLFQLAVVFVAIEVERLAGWTGVGMVVASALLLRKFHWGVLWGSGILLDFLVGTTPGVHVLLLHVVWIWSQATRQVLPRFVWALVTGVGIVSIETLLLHHSLTVLPSGMLVALFLLMLWRRK